MTYSCGIFEKPDQELERAQINKYNKLINLIKPKSADKILEIGCGWGGFAEHLAKNYNVQLDNQPECLFQLLVVQIKLYSLTYFPNFVFLINDSYC